MRKVTATVGSALFLVIAPGAVAGLVPWYLTGRQAGADYPAPARITVAVLTGAGALELWVPDSEHGSHVFKAVGLSRARAM